jgi:hypothetical protein
MRNPFQLGDKAIFVDSKDSENALNGCIVEIVSASPWDVVAIVRIPSTIDRKVWLNGANTARIPLSRARETLTVIPESLNSSDLKYFKIIRKIKQLDAEFEKRQKGKLK